MSKNILLFTMLVDIMAIKKQKINLKLKIKYILKFYYSNAKKIIIVDIFTF